MQFWENLYVSWLPRLIGPQPWLAELMLRRWQRHHKVLMNRWEPLKFLQLLQVALIELNNFKNTRSLAEKTARHHTYTLTVQCWKFWQHLPFRQVNLKIYSSSVIFLSPRNTPPPPVKSPEWFTNHTIFWYLVITACHFVLGFLVLIYLRDASLDLRPILRFYPHFFYQLITLLGNFSTFP